MGAHGRHAGSGAWRWLWALAIALWIIWLMLPNPISGAPLANTSTYEAAPVERPAGANVDAYRLSVEPGSTLWDIAVEALPALVLEAGHERAVELVAASFQKSNPGRGPGDVRLDDEFTLEVPPGTFVTASVAPRAGGRETEYTSFKGDKLTTFRNDAAVSYIYLGAARSEERRVGKECRSRG